MRLNFMIAALHKVKPSCAAYLLHCNRPLGRRCLTTTETLDMRIARSFLAITLTATVIWTGCGGSNTSGGPGGAAAAAGTDVVGSAGNDQGASGSGHQGHAGTGQTPGAGSCLAVGEACQGGTECCSGACDANAGCVSNITVCAD